MQLFKLTNCHGLTAVITSYGARVISLSVPDREGVMRDVVLGFDRPEDYLRENHLTDFGAVIGRYEQWPPLPAWRSHGLAVRPLPALGKYR